MQSLKHLSDKPFSNALYMIVWNGDLYRFMTPSHNLETYDTSSLISSFLNSCLAERADGLPVRRAMSANCF